VSILEFIRLVNTPEIMQSQYPEFLALHVLPIRKAFLQAVFEVKGLDIGTQTFTIEEWMADDLRRRYGWPQAIEAAYNIFIKEYQK
jgi:hypothetical protein